MAKIGRLKIFPFLLALLIMCACSNNTIHEQDHLLSNQDNENISNDPNVSIDIQPYTFTYHEQEFEIIPLYAELLTYIAQAKESSKANWDALYKVNVEDVFQNNAWGYLKTLYGDPSNPMFVPSYSLDKLEELVYLLIEQHDHIQHLIVDALQKSTELLPNKKTRVFLIPSNPEVSRDMESVHGVTGYAYDTQNFVILLEPKVFDEAYLQYMIAHEYHHTVYISTLHRHSRTNDYIHQLLLEGRADAFAHIIYPDVVHLGIIPLDNEQYVWENMKKTMDPDSTISIDFRKGNSAMNIPPDSNYRIGFQIMQDFIKYHPDVTIEEWTNMRASEIFELSKFEERFQD